jgi:hypothetical protein
MATVSMRSTAILERSLHKGRSCNRDLPGKATAESVDRLLHEGVVSGIVAARATKPGAEVIEAVSAPDG